VREAAAAVERAGRAAGSESFTQLSRRVVDIQRLTSETSRHLLNGQWEVR
jgi:hypothetical protein